MQCKATVDWNAVNTVDVATGIWYIWAVIDSENELRRPLNSCNVFNPELSALPALGQLNPIPDDFIEMEPLKAGVQKCKESQLANN